MTKKDFELIARAIAVARVAINNVFPHLSEAQRNGDAHNGASAVADCIADAIAAEVPPHVFDRDRFLAACGAAPTVNIAE